MSAPGKIMLIRHAEKPTGDPDGPNGVTRAGYESEHALTVRGWQRAGALAALFAGSRAVPDPFVVPGMLICPDYTDGKNHRVHQTLEPLAGRLLLKIHQLGSTEQPHDAADAALSSAQAAVLICWDHSNLPELAQLIPTEADVPKSWPEDRFDLVWIFDLIPGAQPSYDFSVAHQDVLDGDLTPPGRR